MQLVRWSMEQADYKSLFSAMRTPVLINLQGATATHWLVCHAKNLLNITIYDPQFTAQFQSATKNKRLLFKVVKTNWKENNKPFLDSKTYYSIE